MISFKQHLGDQPNKGVSDIQFNKKQEKKSIIGQCIQSN